MRALITQLLEALNKVAIVTTDKTIDLDLWAWYSGVPMDLPINKHSIYLLDLTSAKCSMNFRKAGL